MDERGRRLPNADEEALFKALLQSIVWFRDAEPDVWGGVWGSWEEGRVFITVGVTDRGRWQDELRARATRPDRLRVVEVARSEAELLEVQERMSRWLVEIRDSDRRPFVDCGVSCEANAVVVGIRWHDEGFERRAHRAVDDRIVFESRPGEYRSIPG